MSGPPAREALTGGWLAALRRRVSLPAWLVSFMVHLAVFLILALTLQYTPLGVRAEGERELAGEIVIHHFTEQGEYYESQADAQASGQPQDSLAEVLLDTPAVDPSAHLPARDVGTIAGGLPAGGADGLTSGPRQPTGPTKGGGRTKLFDVEAEGDSFVYVFDRSASMASPNQLPLNRAKAELRASIAQLGPTQTFQIIFYNENPTVFNLAGAPGKLVFGNDRNKVLANKFIDVMYADGGTRHLDALKMALSMSPDVIYFLTDADRPALTPSELDEIHRRNRSGTIIHAIKFGTTPQINEENFMTKLARQNGGKYVYIDVRSFSR
jgi:hypothetical protein